MRIQDMQYVSYTDRIPGPGPCGTGAGAGVELVNQLHGRVFVARVLARYHREQLAACGLADDDPITLGDAYAAYTASEQGAALDVAERGHVATERDATAIAYAHARARGETFVYTNDLARMKSGFDLVTRAPDGALVFGEIKGTRGTGGRKLTARLATTRHKGRQLSHRWIWASLLEAGLFSASASLFLSCLRPVLAGAYRRRVLEVSVVAGEITAQAEEVTLAFLPDLAAAWDLSAERAELAELDRLDEPILREDGAGVLADA